MREEKEKNSPTFCGNPMDISGSSNFSMSGYIFCRFIALKSNEMLHYKAIPIYWHQQIYISGRKALYF